MQTRPPVLLDRTRYPTILKSHISHARNNKQGSFQIVRTILIKSARLETHIEQTNRRCRNQITNI